VIGEKLGLEKIEAFHKNLKKCPSCDSKEGFWLAATREKSYVQCKHCGAILEICEMHQVSEKGKDKKSFMGKLKI